MRKLIFAFCFSNLLFLLLIVDKSMAIEGIGGKLAIISPAGTGIGVVAYFLVAFYKTMMN